MAQCYSNTPQWVFFTLFKLYKYYQIAQRITFLKSTERASVPLKKWYQILLKQLFKRWAYFYMVITGNFERFHYFNFETSFLKNRSTVFQLKVMRWKTQNFHVKRPCQKPILRQIEWRMQNDPIKKCGVCQKQIFLKI